MVLPVLVLVSFLSGAEAASAAPAAESDSGTLTSPGGKTKNSGKKKGKKKTKKKGKKKSTKKKGKKKAKKKTKKKKKK